MSKEPIEGVQKSGVAAKLDSYSRLQPPLEMTNPPPESQEQLSSSVTLREGQASRCAFHLSLGNLRAVLLVPVPCVQFYQRRTKSNLTSKGKEGV